MMFGIYPIVAKHFKMFFGDVDNEFLNEVQSRNGFSNSFIVFVSANFTTAAYNANNNTIEWLLCQEKARSLSLHPPFTIHL